MLSSRLVLVLLAWAGPDGPSRPIDTFAGTGAIGPVADGGRASASPLGEPFHCDLDAEGNLYIADAADHRIRRVDAKSGVISTVAGCGKPGTDGDGGPATLARIDTPYAVAVAPNRDLYLVQQRGRAVRKVDGRTGVISTLVGPSSRLVEPNDCCLDGKGGLLIADVGAWRVDRVDLATGGLGPFAGVGKIGEAGDGGPAAKAVLKGARGRLRRPVGEHLCLRA